MSLHWAWLAAAIVAEVIATSVVRATRGFTRLGPSLIALFGYTVAFAMLSRALRTLPLGIAYACWSAAGIALISLAGWLVCGQSPLPYPTDAKAPTPGSPRRASVSIRSTVGQATRKTRSPGRDGSFR